MSAELREAIAQHIASWCGWPGEVDDSYERDMAASLLDGPLRETLRLARIGAWITEHMPVLDTGPGFATVQTAWDYRSAALAAGEPPEQEKAAAT